MRLTSFSFLSLLLLMATVSPAVRSQQPSFSAAGIKPYDKAVPGQVMEVLVEGLGSNTASTVIPATDFTIEVSQDGVTQTAAARIVKFTMTRETKPGSENRNVVELDGIRMRAYHAVSFVVPKGLHPGRAEVAAIYKGQRANPIEMEIVEKPLIPRVGSMAMITMGAPPDRTPETRPSGNNLGWRLERGATARISVNPLVDPDDPQSAILIRFKQAGAEYEAVTRITNTPARVENRSRGVGFYAAREELEVDVPAALTLGKAEVEIRVKANGQVSDPMTVTALITDITRVAEMPNVSAPRVLAVTPSRVGAGQAVLISIDHRRTLEPSPQETRVVIEQDNARYFATIERHSGPIGPSKEPDAPVAFFVRTTRQLIGRVQLRVLNPLRGEQTGISAPVNLEIVDEVLPPQLTDVGEATETDLARLRQMYETQKEAGREFPPYDPGRRYLAIQVRGVDYNPRFVRITLEQGDRKFTLTPQDFSSYLSDTLIVRLPKELSGGEVKFTIENSGGDRYSTPVTKSFVVQSRG